LAKAGFKIKSWHGQHVGGDDPATLGIGPLKNFKDKIDQYDHFVYLIEAVLDDSTDGPGGGWWKGECGSS